MSELYEKSLTKLELDRVLDLLAGHAGSPDGAARCRALEMPNRVEKSRRAPFSYSGPTSPATR